MLDYSCSINRGKEMNSEYLWIKAAIKTINGEVYDAHYAAKPPGTDVETVKTFMKSYEKELTEKILNQLYVITESDGRNSAKIKTYVSVKVIASIEYSRQRYLREDELNDYDI